MRVLVVYESMYGNTHLVADEIAHGMREARPDLAATVVPVGDAVPALVADAQLVVVGGPTHADGMTRTSTRKAAGQTAAKPGSDLAMDPDAEGSGLREWFDELPDLDVAAAAFDTRMDAPPAFTGRASKGIAKRLRRHGATLIVEPQSFLVAKDNHLLRARGATRAPLGRRAGCRARAHVTRARKEAVPRGARPPSVWRSRDLR